MGVGLVNRNTSQTNEQVDVVQGSFCLLPHRAVGMGPTMLQLFSSSTQRESSLDRVFVICSQPNFKWKWCSLFRIICTPTPPILVPEAGHQKTRQDNHILVSNQLNSHEFWLKPSLYV